VAIRCSRCHFDNPADTKFCGQCAAPLHSPGDIAASATRTVLLPSVKLTTGTTFAGRYQIIEELGRGGMGRVYKVYDQQVEAKVALKLLSPDIASDDETIRRFRDELRLARTISHRNVCRMYDLGQSDGTYYITMEYVPGEDLKSFIRRSGQLTVGKAVGIAAQICEGLAEAHRLDVVHRDLKPQNIMIDHEGNARIMDFGIARSLQAKGVTGPGVVIGTPEYMSPEQVEGEAADPRSDVYSLGVILFEMLTGRLPFQGETPLSQALKHKTELPPDPKELNFRIPSDLNRAVLRCLEKKREQRYQSADELAADLTAIEKELPATEPATPRPAPPGKKVRGRSWIRPAVAASLGVLVIIAALFFILRGSRRAGPPEVAEAPPNSWKDSIAVLPFRDQSPQKDQEGVCDAMAESIIGWLSQFQELKVTGTNSVMHYKNTDKDVPQIASELGVSYVLDGTVRREGNIIRVMAELVNRDTKSVVWSNTYDQELKGIFDLQDRIARQIAEALEVKLLPGAGRPPGREPVKNLQAYEYYAKGMSFIKSKYVLTFQEDDFKTGVEMFRKALELDPDYAMAYFGLCWAYEYHYQVHDDEADVAIMQKSAETAQRLDPASALTNALLAYALYEHKGERDRALELCEKARAINSNLGDVVFLTGMCYLYHGLYALGVRDLSRAMELDPYNFWTPYKLAICYVSLGEFDKADACFQKYFELAPPVEPLVYPGRNIGLQIMMKRYEKADGLVRRGEERTPDAEWVRKYRAVLLAVRGEKEKALALYQNSDVYALLGMKDEAFAAFGREIRGSVFNPFIYYQDLVHNPFYDKLRGDSRFEELVAREKKLYDEAVRKYDRPLR
jgi:serine/threonine protein kinase/Flp pilus assembly protein TadD